MRLMCFVDRKLCEFESESVRDVLRRPRRIVLV